MIDAKTLFPMVKRLLPNESDKDILAGMAQFAKMHPDLNNAQALQALLLAIKQLQGQNQPAPQAPQPFGQSLLSNLPTGAK
jgi:hypothetical protein